MNKGFVVAVLALLVITIAWPGGMPELPTREVDAADLVETISAAGEEVDLDSYLQPSSWTLVYFYADW